jgi:twitching motility protein PilT
VSLRLLPTKKDAGRVPAVEIMRITRSIQECIKDPGRTAELIDFLARGRSERMQTFDQHLFDLVRANKISVETALAAASNPTDFQTKLSLEGAVDVGGSAIEEGPSLGRLEIEPDERF